MCAPWLLWGRGISPGLLLARGGKKLENLSLAAFWRTAHASPATGPGRRRRFGSAVEGVSSAPGRRICPSVIAGAFLPPGSQPGATLAYIPPEWWGKDPRHWRRC